MEYPENPQQNYCQTFVLDLKVFKTQICPQINVFHNHKQCFYYHNQMDQRRGAQVLKTQLCPKIQKGFNQKLNCTQDCQYSHNNVEQLYSIQKYKKRFCQFYPDNLSQCQYGSYCSFGHDHRDIQIELIHLFTKDLDFYLYHYKTVHCPYNFVKHNRSACVYAHNYQDFRRKQETFLYEPEFCNFWDQKSFIENYDDGCKNGYNCKKCHGWKEQDFHYLKYKTEICNRTCQVQQNCPKIHENETQRYPKATEFIINMPYNRLCFLGLQQNVKTVQNIENQKNNKKLEEQESQHSQSNQNIRLDQNNINNSKDLQQLDDYDEIIENFQRQKTVCKQNSHEENIKIQNHQQLNANDQNIGKQQDFQVYHLENQNNNYFKNVNKQQFVKEDAKNNQYDKNWQLNKNFDEQNKKNIQRPTLKTNQKFEIFDKKKSFHDFSLYYNQNQKRKSKNSFEELRNQDYKYQINQEYAKMSTQDMGIILDIKDLNQQMDQLMLE